MRLIDADALERIIKNEYCIVINGQLAIRTENGRLKPLLPEMPTVYDVKKVVTELEQQAEQYGNRGFEYEKHGYSAMADKYYAEQCSYLHAIDIVKRGGVE